MDRLPDLSCLSAAAEDIGAPLEDLPGSLLRGIADLLPRNGRAPEWNMRVVVETWTDFVRGDRLSEWTMRWKSSVIVYHQFAGKEHDPPGGFSFSKRGAAPLR